MTDIAPHLQEQFKQIDALSDDELNKACADTLEITSKNLERLALIVSVKESRGHDLSSLRCGMLRYLRKIAAGKLLPEVVATYAHKPGTINSIATLPIDEQRDIVESKSLPSHLVRKHRHPVTPASASNKTAIIVDKEHGWVVVTGTNVVITRNELLILLRRLGGSVVSWMCSGCGEDAGEHKPKKCLKCGSHSFESAGAEVSAA